MYRLGIDLGTSAVKLALLDEHGELQKWKYRLHHGSSLPALRELLTEINEGQSLVNNAYVLLCGIQSGLLDLPTVGDIVALTEGARKLAPSAGAVIAIGGQSARYITGLNDEIPQFAENDSCASGTGSFFENQMARLGLPLTQYSALAEQAKSIPRIAGRCSVFAKTDIIHCQNEGIPAPDILLGLCYASVRSYKAMVAGKLKSKKPVLLVGGVGYNAGVVRAIREVFELSENELILRNGFACVQAIGAAAMAAEQGVTISFKALIELCDEASTETGIKKLETLPPLSVPPSVQNLHQTRSYLPGEACYLGIDIGSTSTNLVLLGEDEHVIETIYLRTKGAPKQAVREGFTALRQKYGDDIRIKATSTTGSGRVLIGRLIGADCIKDEITAQAIAAARFTPDADTVFEIGGQDSKYISLRDGRTGDFQMNKICAAGTGSFIEEQATKLNIPLEQYGDMALSADAPADLGEHCTVFIESRVEAFLAQGVSRGNIAAGLCYSIINNYLNRVVGTKPIGNCILLQGGVAYNPGIVAAFKGIFGNRIFVAPYFSVSGAVGAALLAKREIGTNSSTFKGLAWDGWDETPIIKTVATKAKTIKRLDSFADLTVPREPGKKTIGIPRALSVYEFFPVFHRFFHALGYNVLLSDVSSDATVELGQSNVKEEVCFPLKLAVGHTASLAKQKVDYIFMPSVHGRGICVYMQKAPQILASCVGLKEKRIRLLAPDICMDQGRTLSTALLGTAKQLGHGVLPALRALLASGAFGQTSRRGSRSKPLPVMAENEIGFVLVSRSYGLIDPILSLDIKQKLGELGYKVYDFPYEASTLGIDGNRSSLYWPFGREVLAAAKRLRENPKLYPIYLTYHGCGPDTMLTHWFDNEMGDRPYLSIEVDEHSSPVGIMTRLEAFANSVSGGRTKNAMTPVRASALDEKRIQHNISAISKKRILAIPHLYPYSELFVAALSQKGYHAVEMPPTSIQSLAKGRELMRGKEYFTLTALLGDCLAYAGQNKGVQLFIPQNMGAENDGLYAQFIRCKLDEQGYSDAVVIAPQWERLLKDKTMSDILFAVFLAGDILLCTEASKQEQFLSKMKKSFASGLPIKENFFAWARSANSGKNAQFILCAGEPACFLNPLFYGELKTRCQKAGYTLRYAPLSELLLFEQAENGAWAKAKEGLLRQISGKLGFGSPFAASISQLSQTADSVLGSHAAAGGRCAGCSIDCRRDCKCRTLSAGGRFRSGKSSSLPSGYYGLIRSASMYENISSVLSLTDDTLGAKRLDLRFDGAISSAESARIDTWLHYQNAKQH
ncbi:acyl-CoA dehydratase activase [Lachnospiraceae bacterium ZAX-1]